MIGIVKVMAMDREEAGMGGEEGISELKFDGNDLMALGFGRLLGEPRQATLAKVSQKMPSINSAKASSPVQETKVVPLVTLGPGGIATQSNKSSTKEDDYMDLFQKPAIPSPSSIKPSWPKDDAVPPMLIAKSKKAVESVNDSLLRKPTPGDKSAASKSSDIIVDSELEPGIVEDPKVQLFTGKSLQAKSRQKQSASAGPALGSPSSDVSEEQFAKLLELAGSTGEDQGVPSKTSTLLNNLSKQKRTPRLGLKPVLIAKPVNESKEVASGAGSMSASSNDLPEASLNVETASLEDNAEPTDSDAESGVDLSGLDEVPTACLAKPDNTQSDPEQSIFRLVKEASRVSPVRRPKRFPQAPVSSADDRLAGWSDEVKAAVKRSEAALPSILTQAPSENDFDQLLRRQKLELRQRPVPPPTPEISPDPTEVSMQQRFVSRPAAPSPKPRDVAGTILSDERIPSKTAKVVDVAVEREHNQWQFPEKEAKGEVHGLAQKMAQLMTSLNVGDVVKCTIKKITNFGAFVELQGVPALIHISELSWSRLTDPLAIVNIGQEVEVKVCRLDRRLQRISLSLKQMHEKSP